LTRLFGLALLFSSYAFAQQVELQSAPTSPVVAADAAPTTAVTDAERGAIAILATDLDCHLTPAVAREEVNATLTVRNTSSSPLARIELQISGSLHWTRVAVVTPQGLRPVAFTQSPVPTDTDHTGFAQELVFAPVQPLPPGASATLSVLYGGRIEHSSARLDVLGADPGQAAQAEWDQIVQTSDAGSTALRGFGDVLWYPVAAPLAALGEGNRLFELVARQRRLNAAATMRLRLTVEYAGDPPDAAIFNGTLQPLSKLPDEDTTLVDQTNGIATAEFASAPMGDRSVSLFLTAQRALPAAGQLLSVITPVPDAIDPYAEAAQKLEPLLTGWFGPTPTVPLTLLDHPGAPFEDEAFIAAHLVPSARPEAIAPELVRGLTHAFIHPAAPTSLWLDRGLPELMSLLWTEQSAGRAAALAELRHSATLVALVEPDAALKPGEPLTTAYSDVYLRLKSAAVLWQLRELLGEEKFKAAILAFRRSLVLNPALERDPEAFEKSIERTTGVDLAWFFTDWVYRDRGLPDLTVQRVGAREQLTSKSQIEGYLVAVEVKNDGDAVADVPVIVRSTEASIKDHVRVAAHGIASVRVFFRGRPETVEINDGSVPELRTSVHQSAITLD
jgi:hypothetical protein